MSPDEIIRDPVREFVGDDVERASEIVDRLTEQRESGRQSLAVDHHPAPA